MRKRLTLLIFLLSLSGLLFAQQKPQDTGNKKVKRNSWGINLYYAEKGFGLSTGFFKPLNRTTDLSANIGIAGITDNSEFEYYDFYGNSIIPDKINRVYMIPLNIGLQHYIFQDDIDGSFKPLITIGLTPVLVLTNPYNRGFFSALGYTQPSFAAGGYVGAGLEFQESNKISVTLHARFYYLPVLGREVSSLKNKPINNLGGMQIMFGFNFLH